MKKIKKYEELTIKDDFMFGIIMRNPKYCKTFLETVLSVKINRIEYPQAQKTIDISLSSKSVRLDIFIEDDKSTIELLKRDYNLRDVEVRLIEEFLKLDENERDVLINYLERAVGKGE